MVNITLNIQITVFKKELKFQFYPNSYKTDQYIRIFDVLIETFACTFKAVYEGLKNRTDEVQAEYREEAENGLSNHFLLEYSDYVIFCINKMSYFL